MPLFLLLLFFICIYFIRNSLLSKCSVQYEYFCTALRAITISRSLTRSRCRTKLTLYKTDRSFGIYRTPDQGARVFYHFPEDSRLLATLYSVVVRVPLCQRGSPLPVTRCVSTRAFLLREAWSSMMRRSVHGLYSRRPHEILSRLERAPAE